MSINLSFKKATALMADHFLDQPPLIIKDLDAQNKHLEALCSELASLHPGPTYSISKHQNYKSRHVNHRIDIDFNKKNWSQSRISVSFVGNELFINYSFESIYMGDAGKLIEFLKAVEAAYVEEENKAAKKTKINGLKSKAILANINLMALEDGFEYDYYEDKVKIALLVKLTGKEYININIPYGKYQEVLAQVRPLIASLRALQEQEISFKVKGYTAFSGISWKKGEEI